MKILYKILVTLTTGLFLNVNAQEILVSHSDYPSSHLKMIGNNQGFHLPNVHLVDITKPNPLPDVVDGMMVYNTNPNISNGNGKGIYTNINNKWIFAGENYNYQIIEDYDFLPKLGYEIGYSSEALDSFIFSDIKLNKESCSIVPNIPNSEYCLYKVDDSDSTKGLNWQQAFSAAKQIKGHLITITSKAEQNAIENIISTNLPIWLGLRKVFKKDTSGENQIIIPYLYNITGEEFDIEWSNEPKQFNKFAATRSTNVTDNCIIMNTDSFWEEKSCDLATVKSVLVEFKKD